MRVEDAIRKDGSPATDKAKRFLEALRDLCVAHEVCLSVSDYDGMQVWDLNGDSSDDAVHCSGIEDRTEIPYD